MFKDNFCDICNKMGAQNSKKYGKYLCHKHYNQYRKYGYAIDNNPRTVNDLNEINIIGDTAYINIYNNKNEVIYIAIIDADEVDKIKNKKWRASIKRGKPYIVSGHSIYLSRFILNYNGEQDVDHIDGDVLNNKKNNLRIISHNDNTKNLKHRYTNKCGIRGVSYSTRDKIYRVDFSCNNIRIYPKTWKTLEEAVYCRFYLEQKVLKKYRYTGNDEKILSIIEKLDLDKKNEIEKYTDKLILEKFKDAS